MLSVMSLSMQLKIVISSSLAVANGEGEVCAQLGGSSRPMLPPSD